ncbi:MAG TPA: LacI family DNA-binding transcriptional regulator [Ktedonobacteraceae bacterium]|nr:LacI family DNA-binding transcriptional regulator [Ktedonobacteraceae bacterium]
MVTIYDIAKVAGVGKSTVANALTGKGTVNEATRQRILQLAREMGYRPNLVARNLSQHKTLTIALILPTLVNPFYPEIVEAVENIVRQHDYQTVICNTHYDFALAREQMDRLISRWIDGYIIMGTSMELNDIIRYIKQGLPIVLCDWQENESAPGIAQVSVDFYRAGQIAAEHLLELGHRSIAVIVDKPWQALRLEGFQSMMLAAGIPVPVEMIEAGNSTFESGYAATKKLLAHPVLPTAIFAANDLMAFGAMEAVLEKGLRVPQDISIIGLDDIAISAHLRPPLTTVALPKTRLAKEAAELLLGQINGNKDMQVSCLVEPYLVVRQSTAHPPT